MLNDLPGGENNNLPGSNSPAQPPPPTAVPKSWLSSNIHHAHMEKSQQPKEESKEKPQPHSSAHQFDLIKTEQTNTYRKVDPPLIDLKITNPVTYLKKWFKRVLGNEGIIFSFRIRPLTAILMAITIAALVTGTGIGLGRFVFGVGIPEEVIYTGTIYKSNEGNYYFITFNFQAFSLKRKQDQNLSKFTNQQVLLKGKLNKKESNLEATEVFAIN